MLDAYDKHWRSRFQLFVDGGIRRGSDIFKAVALGATAVGIGRPYLYGLASYGEEGIKKVLQLFKEELVMTMKLMGTPSIKNIGPEHVDVNSLSRHTHTIQRKK